MGKRHTYQQPLRGSNKGRQAEGMLWPCLSKRAILFENWKRWDLEQKIVATTLHPAIYPEVTAHIRRRIRLMQEALHEQRSQEVATAKTSLGLTFVFIKKHLNDFILWYDETELQSASFMAYLMKRVPQTISLYAQHNDLINLENEKDNAFWVELHFAAEIAFKSKSVLLNEWQYVANIYFVAVVKQMLQLVNRSVSFDTLSLIVGRRCPTPIELQTTRTPSKRHRGGSKRNRSCALASSITTEKSSQERDIETETIKGKSARMTDFEHPMIDYERDVTCEGDIKLRPSYSGAFAARTGWTIRVKNTFLYAVPVERSQHRRSLSAEPSSQGQASLLCC